MKLEKHIKEYGPYNLMVPIRVLVQGHALSSPPLLRKLSITLIDLNIIAQTTLLSMRL
jgi:hypothetical protein